ncbi:hypothetical protein ACFL2K_04700, partial [Candidatus Margulisiibacteriota bacterium]
YYYSSGAKHVGAWKKGKKHGKGTLICPNGKKYQLLFKNGKLIDRKIIS